MKDNAKSYSEKYFNDHFKGGYEKQADNPTFKKKFKEIIALGYKKGKVLDLGCAYGYFLAPFIEARFQAFGVDISSHAVAEAKKFFPTASFQVFDIDKDNLPFKDDSFDVVLEMFVLEHVENYFRTLKESRRVLKKGGLLFIYLPTERRWYGDKTHINIFTAKSLRTILERLNFKVVKVGEEGGRFQKLLGLVRFTKNRNTLFNFVPSGTGSFICCYAVKK